MKAREKRTAKADQDSQQIHKLWVDALKIYSKQRSSCPNTPFWQRSHLFGLNHQEDFTRVCIITHFFLKIKSYPTPESTTRSSKSIVIIVLIQNDPSYYYFFFHFYFSVYFTTMRFEIKSRNLCVHIFLLKPQQFFPQTQITNKPPQKVCVCCNFFPITHVVLVVHSLNFSSG